MFSIKIFVTLLLIQSLQLTFAQDDDDLGSIESLPRFEARRQSSLNAKEDFEYDDNDAASRGPVNPLPARTGRNDNSNEDDYDENQAPQDNVAPASVVVSNAGSVKGQVAPSSSGRLSLPRFPAQPINQFVAPLPVPVAPVPSRPTLVSISTPLAPITVSGKTNLAEDSSDNLSVPRLVRPVEPTKTVRVVKTRVFRPNPITFDQSGSLSSGIKGGIKSSQVVPTVTRVARPVLVTRQPQPTFVQPVVQPVGQPVVQPVVQPVFQPLLQPVARPVPIATPITSGSSGPNVIVPGGVKTVPFVANSKVQPPRLRVITTRRPTTPVAPVNVDEDEEDASADSRPAPVQISGVKTIAAANPVPLVSFSRLTPARTLVQPVRQPTRLEVIYADEKLNAQEQDEDDEDANAAGLSQPNIIKVNRPLAPVPVRVAPQPYLVPLNIQGPRPVQPSDGVFFQPTFSTSSSRPTLVSGGKTNAIKSTFNVRPQPVPVRQNILTPVAPTLVPLPVAQPNPTPIRIDSGSLGAGVQQPRLRVITTQRPTVQLVSEGGLASSVSGVKGSGIASGSRSFVRPVLVQTPAPTSRPLVQVQVQEEPLPTFQQIDLIRTQPVARPFTTIQEQPRPTFATVQPAPRPRPTAQPIVQIRDGAESAELPLPSPPRPIQIVKVTPAPTARPVQQVTQIRESALPSVQPVQISQPRLIPAPQPQVIQISEPARPLSQVRESIVPLFQPLDPSLRPAIPTIQLSQVQEEVAPRETILRQPVRPVQVIRPQPQPQQQIIQVQQPQQIVQVNQVQQPSIVETVQLKESAVPITSSQGNLGGQRFVQPQRPVQTIVTTSQEPAPVPAPQPFEILRLREPSLPQFPLAPRQPQTLVVPVRPRLIPAPVPTQTVQSSNLPLARPNLVQISQEKETVSLPQPLAPAPVIIQQQQQPQQQRQFVSFPSIQQLQANVAPVAPVVNVQPTVVGQLQPLVRQPSVPRLIAPLPLPQPGQQSFGVPLTVQSRPSQPTLIIPQQQRPTVVLSQPQPSPLIVQRQRPLAPLPVQSNGQSADQQLVQIREKASSISDDFSQIEQIRLARA